MTLTRRDIIRYGAIGAVAAVLPAQRLLLDRGRAAADPLACAANRVFTGDVTMPAGFTVPAGETWMFDPAVTTTVTVNQNVIVEGTLQMRPAHAGIVHTLRFEGVNEAAFVGGHTMTPLATDVGLWVTGLGQLDAQGTPRAGWNRTGDDPTWLGSDELVSAPTAPGDFQTFAAFTKGGAVPTTSGPDGVTYPTEIVNLTRNVRIEGTPDHRAHVMFVGCSRPQTLKHVAIRWMTPRQGSPDTVVTGRYGLHFHHCGDGSRGTLIEGVVIRDTGGQAFVPHLSDGITFLDCVAYQIRESGFWWDADEETHDVTFDRCGVFGVQSVPLNAGYNTKGFVLGEGTGMVIRNSVAAGVNANSVNSGAFHWPSTANHNRNVWTFEDNIAHNNHGPAISVWQVDHNFHVVERFVAYHNTSGISEGAYINNYTFRDGVLFGNVEDLQQHALGTITYERVRVAGDVIIVGHVLVTDAPTRFVDCLIGGQIHVREGVNPGVIRFESSTPATDLTPSKFVVQHVASNITIHNSDGSTFTVTA